MNSKLAWLVKFSEKNNLDTAKLLLFFLVVFTLSLNLFYKVSLNGAYVHGLLIDYLIPKIYLAEFFLIPFLIIELKQLKKIKLSSSLCFLLLIFLIRQLLSNSALAALTHLIHIAEICLFFQVIKNEPIFRTKTGEKFSLGAMFAVVIFQSLIAIYQFIFQKSLLNYHLLGETNLHDLANITKAQFFFGERILPYGTLPHPNILAGLIVIFSILILQKIKGCKKTQIALIINVLLIIYLTQSVTALLTICLFLVYLLIDRLKIKIAMITLIYYFFLLILPYSLSQITNKEITKDSITRRVALNQVALTIFEKNVLFGVGINNFTLEAEKNTTNLVSKEIVRFVQPVHNLLFLILSEGGLLLMTIILIFIYEARIDNFAKKTMILLAIASLDHYLISQFSGLGILAIFYLFIKS